MMTPAEFQAVWENMSDEERSKIQALADLAAHGNKAQAELDADHAHLEHTDSVGLVWFGDDPEWLNRRLYDARLDRHMDATHRPR